MGYTTNFRGKFTVSRPDVPEVINNFLSGCKDDKNTILILADYAEENGLPQAKKVRKAKSYDRAYALFHGLNKDQIAYIKKFNDTRRMKRNADAAESLPDPLRLALNLPVGVEGDYFVGGLGFAGQDDDPSVLDHNNSPSGQPGLWCQWTTNNYGTTIQWDRGEKFYGYIEWLKYIIEHFLQPWGFVINGEVKWQGEDSRDKGVIRAVNNVVNV